MTNRRKAYVQLKGAMGNDVFVNPDQVTSISPQGPGHSIVATTDGKTAAVEGDAHDLAELILNYSHGD